MTRQRTRTIIATAGGVSFAVGLTCASLLLTDYFKVHQTELMVFTVIGIGLAAIAGTYWLLTKNAAHSGKTDSIVEAHEHQAMNAGRDLANSHQFGIVHGNVHIGNQNGGWIIAAIVVILLLMGLAGYFIKTRTTTIAGGGGEQTGGARGGGTATDVPKTPPTVQISEPKHYDKPKRVKLTVAVPNGTAKLAPPQAAPAPSFMPPPSPASGAQSLSPYDELKGAKEQVLQLDRRYEMEVNMAMAQWAGPYKMTGGVGMPKTYPASMVQSLNNMDNEETYYYKDHLQQMIQTARDHAIEHMNLTPNQKQEDADLFKEANGQALTTTPIVDLENERPNKGQFIGLEQYLDNLLRKLGDYK